MTPARYDAAADFHQAGWPDHYDDPATTALLAPHLGQVSFTAAGSVGPIPVVFGDGVAGGGAHGTVTFP